jgi:hypothetical protein
MGMTIVSNEEPEVVEEGNEKEVKKKNRELKI